MDSKTFQQAKPDAWIDEISFHFSHAEKLLVRNVKAREFKVVRSDDSGIHVTARGFTKSNLSAKFSLADGFVNVEGTFVPGGKHATILADEGYSAHTPTSLQMSRPIDCIQMILAVPAGTLGIAAWIEAGSLKFLNTLRDFYFWGLRSPDPITFTNIIDSNLLVEDNNEFVVEHASGKLDIAIYSVSATHNAINPYIRPYSIVKIGGKIERIDLMSLIMPGKGECYIDTNVTIMKGLLGGIIDTVPPIADYLKRLPTASYFTHP